MYKLMMTVFEMHCESVLHVYCRLMYNLSVPKDEPRDVIDFVIYNWALFI